MRASHNRHVEAEAASRFGRGSILWRALSWRAGSSLVFLSVAIVSVAAAAAGPIYLAAADQSVLQAHLAGPPPELLGYTVAAAPGGPSLSVAELAAITTTIPGGSGGKNRFAPALITEDLPAATRDPASGNSDGLDLEARTGVCRELTFTAGSCPVGDDQVVLSTRTATELRLRVGSTLVPASRVPHKSPGERLRVSGLYKVPPVIGPYWWGQDPFGFGSALGTSILLDDAFVTPAGAAILSHTLPLSAMAQVPLNTFAITAPALASILAQLSSFTARLATEKVSGSTQIASVFQVVTAEEQQMRGVIAVISLELVLLALMVLYGVASSMSTERRPDMAVAELRGLNRRSIAGLALREPALLLAVAAPTGLVVGWLIVGVVARYVFVAHTSVSIDPLAVWAVVATALAGLAAAAVSSRSLIWPSLVGDQSVTSRRWAARSIALADVVALVLAAVAVTDLLVGRGSTADLGGSGGPGSGGTASNPFAAVAPALVGLAAGILAARLLPFACGVAAKATRWSPRVATALTSRSVMRQPGLARRVLVPAIAVGLLVFSVASYEVARTNRETQGLFTTGAPVVLGVKVAPAVDLVGAVRKADPAGTQAMAAAVVTTPSGALLAVDSSRFAAVASWPSGVSSASSAQVASYLAPPAAPPLLLHDARDIRLRIDLTRPVTPLPAVEVAVFSESAYQQAELVISPLHAGDHEYTLSLSGSCTTLCEITGLTVFWSPPATSKADSAVIPLVLEAVQTRSASAAPWRSIAAGLADPADWTGSGPGLTLGASQAGLSATFDVRASSQPLELLRADAPPSLPAVITTSVLSADASPGAPGQFPAVGLDGSDLTVLSRISAIALPVVGDNGVMVDLQLAERIEAGSVAGAAFQVWCHSAPSAAFLARLRALGVTVVSTTYSSGAVRALDRSGPALAFDLFLLAAIAGGLLAMGALVFAVASVSRKRAISVASLAAVGVPRRVLRRSLVAEYATVVTSGVCLGFLSGVATIRLALGSLPEFEPGRIGPVFDIWIPWTPVLLAAAAALVLLNAGAALATGLVMRRARPESLRLSQ